jgi:P27 family predicted phage terminase small subunit
MPKAGEIGRSRRRKPSTLKEREGTLHGERENKAAPKMHPGIPSPPPYLAKDEAANWERFADVLHNSYKILSKEHFALFESLVTVYTHVQRLDQEIRDNELTVETTRFDKGGNAITTLSMHPAWAARRVAGQELRQLCGSFGLSPADIGRVSKLTPDDGDGKKDPDDEFGHRGVA